MVCDVVTSRVLVASQSAADQLWDTASTRDVTALFEQHLTTASSQAPVADGLDDSFSYDDILTQDSPMTE